GVHLNPEPLSAREWGRRQAARSPRWTDEKWRRVATVFGVSVAETQHAGSRPDEVRGRDAA
ncbi:hypothetical protein ACWEU6_38265, partial [Streptosporangium sandarakinum]